MAEPSPVPLPIARQFVKLRSALFGPSENAPKPKPHNAAVQLIACPRAANCDASTSRPLPHSVNRVSTATNCAGPDNPPRARTPKPPKFLPHVPFTPQI